MNLLYNYYMIKYKVPSDWLKYDPIAIVEKLTEAKAAVLSLTGMPYQQSWVKALQDVQLKSEVSGTSRIEGAEFTDAELEAAMRSESAKELETRSQRQAAAAVRTYRWIAKLQQDRPVNAELIREIHRLVVTDADDDHCEPGRIRGLDQNVIFGNPPHRGADGGEECAAAFNGLVAAIQGRYTGVDLLIQSLVVHYHFAAIHPFLDGNGRTARALEALMLQRAGLKDSLFIAMSNYYYDEKIQYLKILSDVRARDYDLTPFLIFGLTGIATQCRRLLFLIRRQVSKALYRNVMFDLFDRLETGKKRVLAKRQIHILKMFLEQDRMSVQDLYNRTLIQYASLKKGRDAFIRDLLNLLDIGALAVDNETRIVAIRLEWPTEITETEFFEKIKRMPKAKPHSLSF